MTCHTACRKGKLVSVKLRNGQLIKGKFMDRTDRYVLLDGWQQIPKESIRSFKIVRGKAAG